MPTLSRRSFILAGSAAFGIYAYQRGLRYPRLGFEHRTLPDHKTSGSLSVALKHAIFSPQSTDNNKLNLRSIAPEPEVTLHARQGESLQLQLSNLSPTAKLQISGDPRVTVLEEKFGTKRVLALKFNGEQSIELKWRLAEREGAYFAVIGDTGGGLELEWLLHRAEQLGALFLLHLGDFNYAEDEYNRAIELFESASFPCYVSIGNHDYNDSGLVYQQFLDQIGPMNHSFSLAGTRFVNLDSAVDFFPASAGRRGDLFDQLRLDHTQYFDQVVFTHRPFKDPREGRDHVIGGVGEIAWLHEQVLALGASDILTGHVHRSAELDLEGLQQWTVGEGLGFQDIVHQKQVATLLMAKVELGKQVSYQWHAINMPWSSHTSPTHEVKLKLEQPPSKLQWYRRKIQGLDA